MGQNWGGDDVARHVDYRAVLSVLEPSAVELQIALNVTEKGGSHAWRISRRGHVPNLSVSPSRQLSQPRNRSESPKGIPVGSRRFQPTENDTGETDQPRKGLTDWRRIAPCQPIRPSHTTSYFLRKTGYLCSHRTAARNSSATSGASSRTITVTYIVSVALKTTFMF